MYTPSSEAMAYNGGVGEGSLAGRSFCRIRPLPPKAGFKGNRFYGDVDLNLFAGANLRPSSFLATRAGKASSWYAAKCPWVRESRSPLSNQHL